MSGIQELLKPPAQQQPTSLPAIEDIPGIVSQALPSAGGGSGLGSTLIPGGTAPEAPQPSFQPPPIGEELVRAAQPPPEAPVEQPAQATAPPSEGAKFNFQPEQAEGGDSTLATILSLVGAGGNLAGVLSRKGRLRGLGDPFLSAGKAISKGQAASSKGRQVDTKFQTEKKQAKVLFGQAKKQNNEEAMSFANAGLIDQASSSIQRERTQSKQIKSEEGKLQRELAKKIAISKVTTGLKSSRERLVFNQAQSLSANGGSRAAVEQVLLKVMKQKRAEGLSKLISNEPEEAAQVFPQEASGLSAIQAERARRAKR